MERTIIQGIKRLRVLTPYDYDNMDELVQDLSNALEESSCTRLSSGKVKKGRSLKRRSKSTGNLINLGSSVPKSSAVSEDSESSLDDRIRFRMEMSANGSQPQTDSDDIKPKWHHQQLTSWRHCTTNMVESDSVNENFHPTREHRRKRKFKRMAVDPQPGVESELRALSSVPSVTQKTKRVRSLRTLKNKTKLSKFCEADVENVCGALAQEQVGFCGKRKRSIREKSVECSGYHERQDFLPNKLVVSDDKVSNWPVSNHFMEFDGVSPNKSQMEASSSGLSSSESDCGILTNDEGREADDEQSDFFHEPGPASGIPGASAWWEDEQLFSDNSGISDPKFEAILTGSFEHMSETAKQLYRLRVGRLQARTGREIRAGRRRLGKAKPLFSIMGSTRFALNSLKNEHMTHGTQPSSLESTLGKTTVGDIKRRRRTPPAAPVFHAGVVMDSADPIPETNIGNQMLKNMGWEPGTGLGPTSDGIQSPLMVYVRAKNRGLGYGDIPEVSHCFQPPPPPPPPSPQPSFGSAVESPGDFASSASPSNKHIESICFGEHSGSGDSTTV